MWGEGFVHVGEGGGRAAPPMFAGVGGRGAARAICTVLLFRVPYHSPFILHFSDWCTIIQITAWSSTPASCASRLHSPTHTSCCSVFCLIVLSVTEHLACPPFLLPQYFALVYLGSNNMISALSIWSCLKLLTLFRLVGGVLRNFGSAKSAYLVAATTTTGPEAAAAAELMGGGVLSSSSSTGPADAARTSGSAAAAARRHAGIVVAGGDDEATAGIRFTGGQPVPMSSMDADCGAEPSGGYEAAASPRVVVPMEEGPGGSVAASAAAGLIAGSAVPLADVAPPTADEVRSAEMSR